MAVEVTKNINSGECIRCGMCKSVCPTGAITSGFVPGVEKPPDAQPKQRPLRR